MSKRKEKKIQAMRDFIAAKEREFDHAIDTAAALKDPVQRIQALDAADVSIGQQLAEESAAFDKKVNRAGEAYSALASIGIVGAPLGAALGLSIIAPPLALIGIPLLIGGTVGSIAGVGKLVDHLYGERDENFGQHQNHMVQQRNIIWGVIEETIRENAETLAAAPEFEEMLGDERISKAFTEAACDKINQPQAAAVSKEASPKETAPKEAAATRHALSTSSADFDEIINISTYNPKKKAPKGPKA